MTSRQTVVMDLHGLLINHREPKWRYFRDEVGVEFSSANLDQEKLLLELAEYGKDSDFYKRHLIDLLNSDYMSEATEMPGARAFLRECPASWSIRIVTGCYLSQERLERYLDSFSLPRIEAVTRVRTRARPDHVAALDARLYFDDKRTAMAAVSHRGVPCVHVADPEYSTPSTAGLHYRSWCEARQDTSRLERLALSGIRSGDRR